MLSERYRPKTWDDFIGQPVIDEIRQACSDPQLFNGCGERWLFESDGIAGCGKTSAAYVAARELGCLGFDVHKLDSRGTTVADLRELDSTMRVYGWGGSGRKCYVIDEIQHLNRDCQRMLLGLLESLPSHVIVVGITTSVVWADDVDGLFIRWRRFPFRKPDARAIAHHLRIARKQGLRVPRGFRFLSYVQGKYSSDLGGNNIRACIDLLPDALRRFKPKSNAAAPAAA